MTINDQEKKILFDSLEEIKTTCQELCVEIRGSKSYPGIKTEVALLKAQQKATRWWTRATVSSAIAALIGALIAIFR